MSFTGPPKEMVDAAYRDVQGSDRVEYLRWSPTDGSWYRSTQNPEPVGEHGEHWFSVTECGVLEHQLHPATGGGWSRITGSCNW